MPIIKSSFTPPWWLSNPHLQTLWPVLFRKNKRVSIELRTEILELKDGDFLELAFTDIEDKPVVLILHGLEGSIDSHYIKPLIQKLDEAGFGVCFMHFRGCGESSNRLPRSYHSGESGDLQSVVDHLRGRYSQGIFSVVGFSLGGNVTLKWLGEQKNSAQTQTAVAVSVPFELAHAGQRLRKSFSRIYEKHLLSQCQNSYLEKFSKMNSPLNLNVKTLNTFFLFDDQVTAPLHGFDGADDYYRKCSSKSFLKEVSRPTLILHASDDPFMFSHTPPLESEMSDFVRLELSASGGHVGFVCGRHPLNMTYWLDQRIVEWLCEKRSAIF